MQFNKPISRKDFFKGIIYLSSIPLLLLINSLIKNQKLKLINNNRVELPEDIPNGINFLNEIIIYKEGNSLSVYSSKCPHLGCKINKSEGDEIVCPCHGSRFDFHGERIKGPAFSSLEKLHVTIRNGKKTVSISSI